MTSTVLATHECLPSRDIHYSRNSSTAPLPLIPRRLASAPSSLRFPPLIDPPPSGVIFTRASPPTTPDLSITNSTQVHVLPPTPWATAAGLSSTVSFPLTTASPSESVSQPTPLRFRGQRFPAIRPPEQSTPTPAKADSRDGTPSVPRQSAAITLSRNLSESHVDALAASRSEHMLPLPKKKSGEPLKSSLKMKRTPARGSLTVITDPVGLSSSKSAPTTPGHKGVRFHSQLEHVKLFLAEQKPLAVSRDGSPTDTSGTDSEFPSFIYARDDDLKGRPLVMHRIDVPTVLPLAGDMRDVAVETIDLVGTTLEGIVRVRNIAFEKWVAARFTLDKWQTTSEVTARYKESLPNGADRFMFSIKLADVLSRAEEKTLYLAVRYSVAGREIWDNNGGRNYQVRVVREKELKANKEAAVEKPRETSHTDDIADLRRQLEQVVKLGRPTETVGGILAQHSRRRWGSPSPTPSPPLRDPTPSFKSEGSLSARYDFAASLRAPWHPPATPRSLSHARTNTYPSARPNSVPWPQSPHAACGSPRIKPDTSYFPDHDSDLDRDSDDAITLVPSLRRSSSGSGSRNHTRGGTIELSHAPGVKRTPPTSPFGSPVIPTVPLSAPTSQPPPYPRFNSFPPHSSSKQNLHAQDWVLGVSEESTPSISNSSSSSPNRSPSLSPAELFSPAGPMNPEVDVDEGRDSPIQHLDYRSLISRYCFFTGSGPDIPEQSDFIWRTHSASSIEEFLSTGQSPPLGGGPCRSSSPFATPRARGRVASDDELQRSGSATPTGPPMRRLPHTPPTSLLF